MKDRRLFLVVSLASAISLAPMVAAAQTTAAPAPTQTTAAPAKPASSAKATPAKPAATPTKATASSSTAAKSTATKPTATKPTATKAPTSAKKPATASAKPVAAKATPKPATTTRTSLARARAAARARQAAIEREQSEAATLTRTKRDELGNLVPDVHAAAAIVFDPQTGQVLWESNSHDQRSIASLTKMMTAVTFIADEPDLSREVVVARSDVTNASVTYLKAGDRITLGDVLHLTLIASDNGGARVLARTSEGGTAAFVQRMNEMAVQLGLTNTHYADPTGLDPDDMSTAYDLSHLIAFAAKDATLGPIMRTAQFDAHTATRTIAIHSTNRLLGTDVDVRAGKTGFISKAGYCLATLLQIPQGSQVAVVVLGAATSTTRFLEVRHLFNWVVGRAQGIVGGQNK